MNQKFLLAFLLFCLFHGEKTAAQDVRFSQFWQAPVLRNPALVGTSAGDYEAAAMYRQQWQSIGNAFSTAFLHASMRRPLKLSAEGEDYISFALAAYSDKAGSIGLRTTAAYGAVALNKRLGGMHGAYLAFGITGGYLLRTFDVSQMTVDNQWVNSSFVSTAAARENIPNPNVQAWDLGAGLAYSMHTGQDNQHALYFGGAIYNLTRPRWNFMQSDPPVNRPMRISASAGATFRVSEVCRIDASANYMQQGKASEAIVGVLTTWQRRPGRFDDARFSLGGGVFYRYEDALIPMVRVRYNSLSLTAAYDINTSPLKAGTNLRGGYEMSLVFSGVLSGAGKDGEHVMCPVF